MLSCLTSLTEDNKKLVQGIVDNGGWLKSLIHIKDSGNINDVPACAVLHNIFTSLQWFDHATPIEGASDAMLIPTLVNSIDPVASQKNGANGQIEKSTPDDILQLALEIIASVASSLQEALERGSHNERGFEGFSDKIDPMIEDGEDEHNGVGIEADEEEINIQNGEMNDDEIDADMDLVTGDGPDVENDSYEPIEDVTLDRLVRIAAPKILILARPTEDFSSSNPTQSYALSALNNIAWTISSIDFSTGHLSNLHKFWASLAQNIWNEIVSPVLSSNTADIELASSITSLAWALSRSVKGLIKIKGEEHRKFMALYQASKNMNVVQFQSNGAKKTDEAAVDAFLA